MKKTAWPLAALCGMLMASQTQVFAQMEGYDLSTIGKAYIPDTPKYVPLSQPPVTQSFDRMIPNLAPGGELDQARYALLAPGSVDNAPIPSGAFHFGFPKGVDQTYRGVTAARALGNGSLPASYGAQLRPTATSSTDTNICDMPFTRDRGSSGIPIYYNPGGGNPPGGGGTPPGGGGTPPGGGGNPGGGGTPGGGNNGPYLSGQPAYRYTSDGGYMTGAGIIAYPNGRTVRGGPQFMYKSGFGFTDLRRPGMGWTWDRAEVYNYYR